MSYRSYGEFIRNGKTTNDPGVARVSALKGNFDPWFRSFDMDYPDVLRANRYISEPQGIPCRLRSARHSSAAWAVMTTMMIGRAPGVYRTLA